MIEFWSRVRKKAEGLSASQIVSEAGRVLKARIARRYRRARARFLPTQISDATLFRSLTGVDKSRLLERFRAERCLAIEGLTEETAEDFKARFPEAAAAILAEADRVCRHEFEFLGRRLIYDGEVDWHYDPTTGYRWPSSHYSEIGTHTGITGVDIKTLWELARFQHAVPLAQGWLLTGNERYAQEYCQQIQSFLEANPRERGIHWLCAMELGLRAVNLAVSFQVFRHSESFDLGALKALLKLMLTHGLHIERNLEYSHRVTSNHYLSDLLGLLWIGLAFPEFKQSKRWVRFASRELRAEMRKQVYRDGADWEASTGYHALVLEIFFYAYLFCRRAGVEVSSEQWQSLEKMFEYVRGYLRPDLNAPLLGDCDDGRVLIWKRRPTADHSYLLAMGALLLNDSKFKLKGVSAEEAFWVFGSDAFRGYDAMPQATEQVSVAFPDSGLYVMRSHSDYCAVDCGEVGIAGRGSHGHNDALALELVAGGRPFLIDLGSYVYTADPQARNRFRSTAYHNTVRVDGEEQNRIYPEMLFVIGNEARPRVTKWQTCAEYDLLECEHYGYARLSDPVVHRRRVRFEKRRRRWRVEDEFTGSGAHCYEFFFNYDPEVTLTCHGLAVEASNKEARLTLRPDSDVALNLQLLEREASPSYGVKRPSRAVVYVARAAAPFKCGFEIRVL